MLSTITLGFAFLLVATLLTVSVNQRLGQVAALRALGLPRRRIAATLLWESALLVGAGGLLSLPVGWALALGLDRILRDMPDIPERLHFFVFEPRLAALHLGLLAATGVGRGRLSRVGRHAPADCGDAAARDRLVTPIVEGRGLTRTFPMPSGAGHGAARRVDPDRARRVRRHHRAVGLRQVHAAAPARLRRRAHRAARCCSKGATPPR